MKRLLVIGLALCLVAGWAASGHAQTKKSSSRSSTKSTRPAELGPAVDPYAPTVLTMLAPADKLLLDLEHAMSLSDAADQKQWPELKKYLEVFLIGVDRARVTRMDVILTHDTTRYRTSIPIDVKSERDALRSLDKFRLQNLDSLGIESRRASGQLYNLKNAFVGLMRFRDDYATIAEYKEDLPQDAPPPATDLATLLEKNYDIGIDGRNVKDGQESRRKSWQSHRKEILSTLKKREDESDDDFAMRKTAAETQLDEAERLYVEAERILLGGYLNREKSTISLDLMMSPLAGTAFETSIKRIGEKPSRFAAIPAVENPILSGRANVPLDELRINNIVRMTDVMKTTAHHRIDADKDRSNEEKANARKVVDLFFAMIQSGAKTGRLDAFVEAHSNSSGKNTLVAAAVPEDGNAVLEILELLPKTGRGNAVQMNVDSEGDVKIHKVAAPAGFRQDFKDFFGDESLYVGTQKEVLWWAAGEKALEELKAAIRKSAEPAPKETGPFLTGFIKLLPWTELHHKRQGTKGNVKTRERAIRAFKQGDDVLTFQMNRVDDHVEGVAQGMAGVLRLVGANMAEFTRNLDKSN